MEAQRIKKTLQKTKVLTVAKSMIPCAKLFGDNCLKVTLGYQQLYLANSVEKYLSKYIIFWLALPAGGVNKDPTVWLDETRPP